MFDKLNQEHEATQRNIADILEESNKANRDFLKQLIDVGAQPKTIADYAMAIDLMQKAGSPMMVGSVGYSSSPLFGAAGNADKIREAFGRSLGSNSIPE